LSDGFYSTDKNSGLIAFENFNILEKTNLTVGVDFKQYGGKANQGKAANEEKMVNELAAYSYLQQEVIQNITLSAGLRLENIPNYGNELIPLVGVTYNPITLTTFKGSVSKGFRNPTVMEMYLFVPNPDLHPERLVNYEISWLQRLFNSHLNLELTVYKAKGDNMIQVVGLYPNIKRENVGKFTNQGIELSANYIATKQLHVNANYSYLDLNAPIVSAPRQQINVNVNYQYRKYNLNVSAQHIEKLYSALSPLTTVNYTLCNTRIAINLVKGIDLFVMANNILDQKYEINAGYPMPGFNFNGGVNCRF
jgi:iron complex outermembrane receptor protein